MILVWVDGSCRDNGGKNAVAGIGMVARKDNKNLFSIGRIVRGYTNNEAEYYAVIHVLRELKFYSREDIIIYSDSSLVVNQVKGAWQIKNEELRQLKNSVQVLLTKTPFRNVKFQWVPRENNKEANKIAQAITNDKRGETNE